MHLRDIQPDQIDQLNQQISEHGLLLNHTSEVLPHHIDSGTLHVDKNGRLSEAIPAAYSHRTPAIDVQDLHIFPGPIDVHIHARDGEQAYKETWETISRAALAGGVTTAFGMPNTQPLTDSTEKLQCRYRLAAISAINYAEYIGSLGNNQKEISHPWTQQNASGIKLYLNETTGGFTISPEQAFHLAFQMLDFPNKLKFVLHAEGETLHKVALPLLEMGYHIHVAHISLTDEVNFVRDLRKKGYPITAEVTPHHLLIAVDAVREKVHADICELCLMKPPLSPQTDLPELFNGLRDGTIVAVATDHAPHTEEEKRAALAEGKKIYGVPGIQEMLPLMLTHLPEQGFSLSKISQLLSTNPARHFHLKDRGQIKPGFHADLAFVDINHQYKIGDANHPLQSRAGWSLYQDWPVRGDIMATMVNGRFAFANQSYSKNLHSAQVQFER